MLVKDIAQIHDRPVFKINELINRNRKRFTDGLDIIDLNKPEFAIFLRDSGFTQNQINASANIYLLSERGYAKLLKILEDDKAWEVYDQLVDNYFNMRTTIKENQISIEAQERLKIMHMNAETRKASLMYHLGLQASTSEQKDTMIAAAMETLIGHKVMPVMHQKEYTATEIGNELGISKNKVGRLSTQIGLKAEQPNNNEYGRWAMTSANGERPTWLYSEAGRRSIKKAYKQLG